MSKINDNRKRSREDDMYCDVPLSKRINNLHLTNFDEVAQQQNAGNVTAHNFQDEQQFHMQQQQQQQQQNGYVNWLAFQEQQQINENNNNADINMAMGCSNNDQNTPECYDPDLSPEENPYYYMSNKLLYQLHFERLRRNNL